VVKLTWEWKMWADAWVMLLLLQNTKQKPFEKINLLVDSWKKSFSPHLHQGLKWAKSGTLSNIQSGHGDCWRPYQFVELVPKAIPSIRVRIYSLWAVSQFTYSIQFSIALKFFMCVCRLQCLLLVWIESGNNKTKKAAKGSHQKGKKDLQKIWRKKPSLTKKASLVIVQNNWAVGRIIIES